MFFSSRSFAGKERSGGGLVVNQAVQRNQQPVESTEDGCTWLYSRKMVECPMKYSYHLNVFKYLGTNPYRKWMVVVYVLQVISHCSPVCRLIIPAINRTERPARDYQPIGWLLLFEVAIFRLTANFSRHCYPRYWCHSCTRRQRVCLSAKLCDLVEASGLQQSHPDPDGLMLMDVSIYVFYLFGDG